MGPLARYRVLARRAARRRQRISRYADRTVDRDGQSLRVVATDMRAAIVRIETRSGAVVMSEREFLSSAIRVLPSRA